MKSIAVYLLALVVAFSAARARADDVADARRENDKAMSAFALGDYAEAAQHYERAFALRTDAALLYNAAQSHRLAGNKPRALLLYENLERMFAGQLRNKPEIDRHIADLRAAIASETKAKGPPQTTAEPSLRDRAEPLPATAAPQTSQSATGATTGTTGATSATNSATLTAGPAPRRDDDRPLVKKPWFWGVVVGGVVVAGVAIGLGVGLGSPHNPSPSLGGVTVQ